MTTEQIIGFSIAMLIMLVGVVGCLLPVLPGTPIVLLAAIAHKIYFGETGASWFVIIVLTLLTIVSLVFDQLASMIGAKKLGATWKGVTGAVVGGLIGLFFGLPGVILGPFLGATLFEMIGDREFQEALKAGTGATLGLLLGVVGKVAVSVVMILMFSWSVVAHSLEANRTETDTPPAPVEEPSIPDSGTNTTVGVTASLPHLPDRNPGLALSERRLESSLAQRYSERRPLQPSTIRCQQT